MIKRPASNADHSGRPSTPLVAVMVGNAAERRLLADSGDFEVANQDVSVWHECGLDLAILDLPSLLHHETEIRKLKALPPPDQVPVLLVVDDAHLRDSQAVLGKLADDVIRTPLCGVELRARIDNLLRFRSLPDARGLDIEPSALEVKGVAMALHAFSAGNDRTIRACSEQDILSNLCKSLSHDGGYPLAWIGQRLADGDKSIKPVAYSGHYSHLVPRVASAGKSETSAAGLMSKTFATGAVTQADLPAAEERPEPRELSEAQHPTSMIVFPLTRRGQQPSTCLAVYSFEPTAFDHNEVELLQRLIDNALHGIYALREKYSQRRREREAIKLAYRDSLTGLANRTAILKALGNRLHSSAPYPPATALLHLDLDGFKLINDALGHDVGDAVLIEVSRRLQSVVRDGDQVARHGGDDFVILLALDTGAGQHPQRSNHAFSAVSSLAQEILDALQEPFLIEGRNYHIESSIGIGMCPAHAKEAFSLLMKADSAMYEAKKVGGNSFRFFSSELSERRQERLQLESRLYQSVDARAFEIALQPIIDLKDGHIVGAEALLRWPQTDGSYISPAEFIPIAEETGLIIPIGDWVMEESLKAVQRLRSQGFPDLQVAVNLAIAQLWQTHLVERIVSLMHALDLPASALKVELTEGSLMNDIERMEDVVREFRDAGIEVAIDDFGTGYSSLARLKSLPITTLKIDRSFLNGVPAEENAVSVVNTIAHMAHNLGIQSIAEGIETESQWQILQELGCPLGQGFFFARPMPEKDLLALLMMQAEAGQRTSSG